MMNRIRNMLGKVPAECPRCGNMLTLSFVNWVFRPECVVCGEKISKRELQQAKAQCPSCRHIITYNAYQGILKRCPICGVEMDTPLTERRRQST